MPAATLGVTVPVPPGGAIAGGHPPTEVIFPAPGSEGVGELNHRADVRLDPGYEPSHSTVVGIPPAHPEWTTVSGPDHIQTAEAAVAFALAVFALLAARRLRKLRARILMLTLAVAVLVRVA